MKPSISRQSSSFLRAVFFDAGNTLIRMDYDVIAAELKRHGIAVTADQLEGAEWRARVRVDAHFASGTSTESRETGEHYLRYLLDGVGVRDEATLRSLTAWRRSYNAPVGVWTKVAPDAEAALRLVKESGLRTAVISNSNGSIRRILTDLGLATYLDFVLDSSEEGVEKPDPRIFRVALDRADVRPEQAVYVGDLYSVDVLGARAAGLEAVLLDPGGCWGERDCVTARTLLAACEHLIARQGLAPRSP